MYIHIHTVYTCVIHKYRFGAFVDYLKESSEVEIQFGCTVQAVPLGDANVCDVKVPLPVQSTEFIQAQRHP